MAPKIAVPLAVAPIAVVFVARIIEGVSGGNISITQAYVADLVTPKERSRAFGLIGAMFAAGMVFGPAGGGILFAKFGFAMPFFVAARFAVSHARHNDRHAARVALAGK